tara:strand:- start:12163 stop:14130 length:1968 start_codon:yes stop_codon:yes gene_type:complete
VSYSNDIRPENLPQILIIDDQLAVNSGLRKNICDRLILHDIDPPKSINTGDIISPESALASVSFHPGRISPDDSPGECLKSICEMVSTRWGKDSGYWALILIDFDFSVPDNKNNAGKFTEFGAQIVEELSNQFPWKPTWSHDKKRGRCDIPLLMLSQTGQKKVEEFSDPAGSLGFLPKSKINAEDFANALFRFGLVADGALRRVVRNTVRPYRSPEIMGKSLLILRTLLTARLQVCGHNPSETSLEKPSLLISSMNTGKKNKAEITQATIGKIIQDMGADHLKALRGPRILILGERGTGKGLFSKYMHDHSPLAVRSKSPNTPYKRVQLDGLRSTLVESTLFGHVAGAFTGAQSWRPGMFMSSAGGTAFIDEIANVGPIQLRKLLSSIGDGLYSQVGAEEIQIPVSCQIICATNKPVAQMVQSGEFPDDLFDRMTGILRLPPLRDYEGSDRIELFEYFISRRRKESGKLENDEYRLKGDVLNWICDENHEWPGNIRELEILSHRVVDKRTHSASIQLYDLEAESVPLSRASKISSIEELVELIDDFRMSCSISEAWYGQLEKLHIALGELSMKLLKLAYEEGMRTKSKNVQGKDLPTKHLIKALGLTGTESLNGQQQKREVRSFIKGSILAKAALAKLDGDPEQSKYELLLKLFS